MSINKVRIAMGTGSDTIRILLVTFPAQGHINPSLQFAKRLAGMGVQVTFSTSLSAVRCMKDANHSGVNIVPFSDGYDNGWNINDGTIEAFVTSFRNRGSEAVSNLISSKRADGQPFAHVVYTTFMPWVGLVARDLGVESTLLWIQPATTLDLYYYYFTGHSEAFSNDAIDLPGLPVLRRRDVPSFLVSSSTFDFSLPYYKEHIEILEAEENPMVLVNTFDLFESKPLNAISSYDMKGIGPLIPSAFLDGKDPSDTSFGGDLLQADKGYSDWLNEKEDSSVVYVAFGSYSELSKEQMKEIAKGLVKSKKPFLWVIREAKDSEEIDELLKGFDIEKEEVEKRGVFVPWCSQLEVLSHPAVGCFVTHCGWNSSLESLASGVPMVLFPLWSDQGTNARIMEEDGKVGVRVAKNEEGVVEGDEIVRCLDVVMGGEDLRKKAKEWGILAKDAVKEGGSSDVNLKVFIEHVGVACK